MKYLVLCLLVSIIGCIQANNLCKRSDGNPTNKTQDSTHYVTPPDVKRFFFCMFYNRGWIDESSINHKKKHSNLKKSDTEEDQNLYPNMCMDKSGKSREETALNIYAYLTYLPIKMNEKCINETYITGNTLWDAFRMNFNKFEMIFKDYTYCYLKEEAIIDEDGKIDQSKLSNITNIYERYYRIFDKCSKNVDAINGPEESWTFTTCIILEVLFCKLFIE